MAKCTETKRTVVYTLELSEEEARVIKFLVGAVSGNSKSTWRGMADAVFQALDEAGVRNETYPPASECGIHATGPLLPNG